MLEQGFSVEIGAQKTWLSHSSAQMINQHRPWPLLGIADSPLGEIGFVGHHFN